MSKKQFRAALGRLDVQKKTRDWELPGILGIVMEGTQTVSVSYRPNFVYVQLRNNSSEVIQAYNDAVSLTYGLPVIVTRDEIDRTRYIIKGIDRGIYPSWGGYNYPANHSHDFPQGVLAFDDEVFLATGLALDFLGDVRAFASGTTVFVDIPTGTFSRPSHIHPDIDEQTLLIYDDGVFKVTGTAINFTTNINVAVTGSVAYVSSVDTIGGGGGGADVIIYEDNTFKATGTAIHFSDNLDVVVTGSSVWVNAVGVTGSTGAIGPQGIQGPQGDNTLLLYDSNAFIITGTAISFQDGLVVHATGSVAYIDWSGSSAGGGHTIQDDGVGQTQRTNLNFVGDGFVVWDDAGNDATIVSGTAVAGPQGPPGAEGATGSAGSQGIQGIPGDNTLLIYDDNTFSATGTALHFKDNLAVIVSGSSAWINGQAGGSAGGSTLLIYDDSIFKVTGTAISFDTNLYVSVTGSAAFVSYTGSAGIGDVVGPASSIDSNVVAFNGTSGKTVKDGGANVSGLKIYMATTLH